MEEGEKIDGDNIEANELSSGTARNGNDRLC